MKAVLVSFVTLGRRGASRPAVFIPLLLGLAVVFVALTASAAEAGDPVAWGYNFSGQCDVPGDLPSLTAIAGGEWHSLALLLPPPVADFSGSPTSGTVPLTVEFTDLSTNSPTAWQWEFGDGSASSEQNPSYTYVLAGIYTPSMTATNASGSDTETKARYIVVNFVDVG
jgi:PKD repeat protein